MSYITLLSLGAVFLFQAHYGLGNSTLRKEDLQLSEEKRERQLQKRGTVVFYDDFSEGYVNKNKWVRMVNADGVGHNEFQMYTPENRNSFVRNGVLYIRPTLTADSFGEKFVWEGTLDVRQTYGQCSNGWCVAHGWNTPESKISAMIHPVMSGYLSTTATIRYGRVEVVAQLPKGDWLWPAIWLMPRDPVYGKWPRSGEIDIMEAAGNGNLHQTNGQSLGVDLDRTTLHYGPSVQQHVSHHADMHCGACSFADSFHTYWMDWTKDYIKIGIDNHTTQTHWTPPEGNWKHSGFHGDNIWASGGKDAPFDRPFYLILNVAVGGSFFSDRAVNKPYPKPWSNQDTARDQLIKFWNAHGLWYPTWHGDDTALKVKAVKMVQY